VELLVKRRKGVDITKGMLKGGIQNIEYRIQNGEVKIWGMMIPAPVFHSIACCVAIHSSFGNSVEQ